MTNKLECLGQPMPRHILITLYRCWSEDTFASGFETPCPRMVSDFRKWLFKMVKEGKEPEPYEAKFLAEYLWQQNASEIERVGPPLSPEFVEKHSALFGQGRRDS